MTTSAPGPLHVGAARVEITTPVDRLPPGYLAVHDPVYARAIVLDNGHTRAVLLGADLGMFTEDSYAELSQRIAAEVGCPVDQILMSCTHTHGSPSPGAVPVPGRSTNVLDCFDVAYATWIKDHVFEAVRRANAHLKPGRVGYATGSFHVNVNRDAVHPQRRIWYQGPNLDGPSDKAVRVIKFETLAGEPLAVYVNYAMHANMMFMRNQISGGFPGAMSRYIEAIYDDRVVAVWTAGAAGDQNPLYLRLAEPAIAAQKRPHFAAAGGDPDNVIALANYTDAPLDPKTLDLNARLVDSIGLLLGEEVIRIMDSMPSSAATVPIWGKLESVECPGRRRTNTGREGAPGTYEEADPIQIRIGLLRIGNIGLLAVTGELYTPIWFHLLEEAPLAQLMVVTLANGKSVGYIVDDSAYERHTFQVLGTRMQKGFAEQAVIRTALDLIRQSMQ